MCAPCADPLWRHMWCPLLLPFVLHLNLKNFSQGFSHLRLPSAFDQSPALSPSEEFKMKSLITQNSSQVVELEHTDLNVVVVTVLGSL